MHILGALLKLGMSRLGEVCKGIAQACTGQKGSLLDGDCGLTIS